MSDRDDSTVSSWGTSGTSVSSDGSSSVETTDGIRPLRNLNVPEYYDRDWEVRKIYLGLPRNDPRLRHLQIGADQAEFCPRDGDWERTGECIANHSYLKTVVFGERIDGLPRNRMKALYKGIARSQSITKLWVYDLRGYEFDLLAAAFRNNPNLRRLCVGNDVYGDEQRMDCESTRLFAKGLRKFHSLTELKFIGKDIGDDAMKDLLEALKGHLQLKRLSFLGGIRLGRESGIALAALVQHPKSELRSLDLRGNTIGSEGAAVLAVAIAGNRALRSIKLSRNERIGTTGLLALTTAFGSTGSTLKSVSLWSSPVKSPVNDAVVASLARALTQNTSIRSLDLDGSSVQRSGSWQTFFEYLRDSTLAKLVLHCSTLIDNTMTSLARCLVNNTALQELSLSGSNGISMNGWRALSAVLRAPHSALTQLELGFIMSERSAEIIADSLSSNTRLKELSIRVKYTSSEAERDAVHGPFLPMLCDTATVTDTYLSNHTLVKLTDGWEKPWRRGRSKLWPLLEINRENGPKAAARIKILRVHFSGNDVNLRPFLAMDLGGLPHAAAWILRDGLGLNLAYHFLRASPSMFTNRKSAAGLKSLVYRYLPTVPSFFNGKGGSRKRKRGA